DQFAWSRKASVVVVAGVALVGGLPLDVNMGWFMQFVDLVTVYLAPLGAAMAAVLFFWVHSVKEARRVINVGAARPLGAWWEPVAKYLFVGVSLLIVVLQMLFRIG
ncbi:MAG: sodium-dependent transporter, partial [Chloroflexi bacterium]|nr:sodium-dependent transporter [Chloroflexota bacterium]